MSRKWRTLFLIALLAGAQSSGVEAADLTPGRACVNQYFLLDGVQAIDYGDIRQMMNYIDRMQKESGKPKIFGVSASSSAPCLSMSQVIRKSSDSAALLHRVLTDPRWAGMSGKYVECLAQRARAIPELPLPDVTDFFAISAEQTRKVIVVSPKRITSTSSAQYLRWLIRDLSEYADSALLTDRECRAPLSWIRQLK